MPFQKEKVEEKTYISLSALMRNSFEMKIDFVQVNFGWRS